MPQATEIDDDPLCWVYSGKLCDGPQSERWLKIGKPTCSRDLRGETAQLPNTAVVQYLDVHGFMAESHDSWGHVRTPTDKRGAAGPRVTFAGLWHYEEFGHTWYAIACHLTQPSHPGRHWQVDRRLAHVRGLLHNPVRNAVGRTVYEKLFCRQTSRFVQRGVPPGTSDRLESWLVALADAINKAEISPSLTALTLRFFQAPSEGQYLSSPSMLAKPAEIRRPGSQQVKRPAGQGANRAPSNAAHRDVAIDQGKQACSASGVSRDKSGYADNRAVQYPWEHEMRDPFPAEDDQDSLMSEAPGKVAQQEEADRLRREAEEEQGYYEGQEQQGYYEQDYYEGEDEAEHAELPDLPDDWWHKNLADDPGAQAI